MSDEKTPSEEEPAKKKTTGRAKAKSSPKPKSSAKKKADDKTKEPQKEKDLGDKAKDMLDDAKKEAKKVAAEAKEKAKELKEDAVEFAQEAKEKASGLADDAKETVNEFTESVKETFDSSENKKVLAGVLAIVLGSVGVHKFILGYNKEGGILVAITVIGMLLMCVGVGFFIVMATSVVGLVEGIIYLTKSDEEFYNTYQAGRKPWF